jgi:hypothetical protein
MVRSAKRVSNHEATDGPASFETPLSRLLGMRVTPEKAWSLAMTKKHTFSFPRHVFARVVHLCCPSLLREGAGKAGRWMHPQSRVRRVAQKSTRVKLQVQPRHPGFPRAMVLRLIRALPGERRLLPPSPAGYARRLDATVAAPGPHDFAVRCGVFVRREDPA